MDFCLISCCIYNTVCVLLLNTNIYSTYVHTSLYIGMPNPDSTLQPLYTLRGVTEIRTISCTPSAPSGYNITWSVNGMIMNNLMNQNTITISANSSRGVHCCEIIPESAGNPIQYCTYVLPSCKYIRIYIYILHTFRQLINSMYSLILLYIIVCKYVRTYIYVCIPS